MKQSFDKVCSTLNTQTNGQSEKCKNSLLEQYKSPKLVDIYVLHTCTACAHLYRWFWLFRESQKAPSKLGKGMEKEDYMIKLKFSSLLEWRTHTAIPIWTNWNITLFEWMKLKIKSQT